MQTDRKRWVGEAGRNLNIALIKLKCFTKGEDCKNETETNKSHNGVGFRSIQYPQYRLAPTNHSGNVVYYHTEALPLKNDSINNDNKK